MSVSTAPRAMNLARLLVMSCVLVLAAAPAQARTGKASEMLPAHALDLGYQVMSFYYEEGSLMNEGGVLHGVFGRYTAHLESAPVMLRLEGEYSGGNLDYDGQYQDGTPATRDTDDRLAGARGLVGWTLPMDRAAFIPYTGLGFRYWNDTIQGDGGYEREISQYYVPIGLEGVCAALDTWRFTARAEYDLFLGGRVRSHLEDVDAGYDTVSNDQNFGDGWGLRASFTAERRFDGWSLGLEPFWRYWDIEQSDADDLVYQGRVIGTAWEPANTITIWGLRVFAGF